MFFVIILLIAGVFGWAFWLNKGTLVVKSDREFRIELNGEIKICAQGLCEIKLTPREYSVVARSNGYYDETLAVDVSRWSISEKILNFELVPYLKDVSAADVPVDDVKPISKEVLSLFESLKDPMVKQAGNTALVLDQGRIFFVDLDTKRRVRRFDDTVQVNDARLSDDGDKVLLFVKMAGQDLLWIWKNSLSELTTFDWYEKSEFIQWAENKSHIFYIITDKLVDLEKKTILEDAAAIVETQQNPLVLFKYNLDTDDAKKIEEFSGETPVSLLRRGDRFFVSYASGRYRELVVK